MIFIICSIPVKPMLSLMSMSCNSILVLPHVISAVFNYLYTVKWSSTISVGLHNMGLYCILSAIPFKTYSVLGKSVIVLVPCHNFMLFPFLSFSVGDKLGQGVLLQIQRECSTWPVSTMSTMQ